MWPRFNETGSLVVVGRQGDEHENKAAGGGIQVSFPGLCLDIAGDGFEGTGERQLEKSPQCWRAFGADMALCVTRHRDKALGAHSLVLFLEVLLFLSP